MSEIRIVRFTRAGSGGEWTDDSTIVCSERCVSDSSLAAYHCMKMEYDAVEIEGGRVFDAVRGEMREPGRPDRVSEMTLRYFLGLLDPKKRPGGGEVCLGGAGASLVHRLLRELQERRKKDCEKACDEVESGIPDPAADLPRSMCGELSLGRDLYIHAGSVLKQVAEANSRSEVALKDAESAKSFALRAGTNAERADSKANFAHARIDNLFRRLAELEARQ